MASLLSAVTSSRGANLEGEDLSGAKLMDADLSDANLSGTDLSGGDLMHATLVGTNLEGANLTACSVYGVSVWNVSLRGAVQSNLLITPADESAIQVYNLEVAQFIYLLLNNEKIRDVINTVGKKAVLILGRFTTDRKAVLDAIREALKNSGYLPILFDFEKPGTRDTQETIITLAGFDSSSQILPTRRAFHRNWRQSFPTFPRCLCNHYWKPGLSPAGMYDHIDRYPWVLPLVRYENREALLTALPLKVVVTAEAKAEEQAPKKK